MSDLYENWPVTSDPPTRRIVDPPMPVLVSVALTVAGAAGGSFRDGTPPLEVRAEGLAMDIKVQGTLHAWARTHVDNGFAVSVTESPQGTAEDFFRCTGNGARRKRPSH